MNMPYWWYQFLVWLTWPFRIPIMFWYPTEKFCIDLLWRNEWKALFIWSQCSHETNHWQSKGWKDFNNPCGMRPEQVPPFTGTQDGKRAQLDSNGNPTGEFYAVYRSKARGIYDLYDYYYRRSKGAGNTLDSCPNEQPFTNDYIKINQSYPNTLAWIASCVATLKNLGFFTAPTLGYAVNLEAQFGHYRKTRFWFTFVFAALLAAISTIIFLWKRIKKMGFIKTILGLFGL